MNQKGQDLTAVQKKTNMTPMLWVGDTYTKTEFFLLLWLLWKTENKNESPDGRVKIKKK